MAARGTAYDVGEGLRCNMRRRRLLAALLGFVLLGSALPALGARAQAGQRCFGETGLCIAGRIYEFWEQNGGLPVFGLPISPQQEELVEGQPRQVQRFERNRLELHPQNPRPYDVLLGRLGVDRLDQQGRSWFQFPKSEPQASCQFFPETGHNVCGDILAAWRANGLEFDGRRGKSAAESLALFGLPLSDAQTEMIEGKEYTVQWFERARFELHPENAPPYDVLLGLLGREVSAGGGPAPVLPHDGHWAGSTSQGKPIAFDIVAGGTAYNNLEIEVSRSKCDLELRIYNTSRSIPLRDNKISTSGSDGKGGKYSIAGQFDSPQAASGTFSFENYDPGGCSMTMSGTWTAALK